MTINGSISPYSTGLQLLRSTDLVGATANYILVGTLPDNLQNMKMSFNGSSPISIVGSINNTNILLGSFVNPSSTNWNISNSVKIFN